MHVNELAKQVGVAGHVVRYYTRMGLLHPVRDPKNQYREYADSDVYRLRFIRHAKRLGFTLCDAKTILRDTDSGVAPGPEVREIIKKRARQNRERLRALTSLQERIEAAVALWETLPDQPLNCESLCHLVDALANANDGLS